MGNPESYRGFTKFLKTLNIKEVFILPDNVLYTSLYQSALQAGIKVKARKNKITGEIVVKRIK